MPEHEKRSHALLSPSSAHRWMVCPKSVLLTAGMPDRTSPEAQEGTRAHEFADAALSTYIRSGIAISDEPQTDDDRRILAEVDPYISYAIRDFEELKDRHADAVMFVETKVDFSEWVPDGHGTADLIMIADHELYVRDLKFGKGVEVAAVNNPQIRCYALGALNAFGDLYEDIDTVICQIHQPRLGHFTTETLSAEALLAWAEKSLKPAAVLALSGEGEYVPGEHCRFCKAAATCRARADYYLDLQRLKDTDPDLLTHEEISEVLEKAETLNSWVKAIKDKVTNDIINGTAVYPGWKVVEGRSLRQWSNDLVVAERLKDKGYDDAVIYNRKLLGITEMQRLVGGKKAMEGLLGDLIIKPQGKPTLVTADDAREAYMNVVSDFDGIDIED